MHSDSVAATRSRRVVFLLTVLELLRGDDLAFSCAETEQVRLAVAGELTTLIRREFNV